jgi:hypothetical protein
MEPHDVLPRAPVEEHFGTFNHGSLGEIVHRVFLVKDDAQVLPVIQVLRTVTGDAHMRLISLGARGHDFAEPIIRAMVEQKAWPMRVNSHAGGVG